MTEDTLPKDMGLSGHEHVYAIIRLAAYGEPGIPLEDKVRIKMLVWTQELAESEVKRLNELNGAKGSLYFWQRARLARRE